MDKVKERPHEQGILQWRAWKEGLGSLSLYSKVLDMWGEKFILSWC